MAQGSDVERLNCLWETPKTFAGASPAYLELLE
jgi:hypothetical protein